MKLIRNLFFIVLPFTTLTTIAQDDPARAQKMTDRMKADLALTDERAARVLPVNESFVTAVQPLSTSSEGKLAKYRKFNAADTQRDHALETILTKEQFAAFKEWKNKNREALKDARKNNR